MSDNKPAEPPKNGAHAFSRSCRLTKTDEYSSVFGFRKSIKSRHFLLHYRLQAGGEERGARLGLVVAKRLLRRSVDRNLIRRLARESFRHMRDQLPPFDCILRLALRPEPLERKGLAEEIRSLLARLKTNMESR